MGGADCRRRWLTYGIAGADEFPRRRAPTPVQPTARRTPVPQIIPNARFDRDAPEAAGDR